MNLWLVLVIHWTHQLQGSQQVSAGFNVVQTSNDGGKRPATTNTAQGCHDPVAVVMDVKGWTSLLQDSPQTGSETQTDGDVTC